MAQLQTEHQQTSPGISIYLLFYYTQCIRCVFIVTESVRITDVWNLKLYSLVYLCFHPKNEGGRFIRNAGQELRHISEYRSPF